MNYLVKLVKSDQVAILLGNQASLYSKKNEKNAHNYGLAETYCSQRGIRPTLDSYTKGLAKFNEASRKIAEQNAIPFVDIDSQIPKTLEYMYDDVHYRYKGDTLIANILNKAIVENKFIEKQTFP